MQSTPFSFPGRLEAAFSPCFSFVRTLLPSSLSPPPTIPVASTYSPLFKVALFLLWLLTKFALTSIPVPRTLPPARCRPPFPPSSLSLNNSYGCCSRWNLLSLALTSRPDWVRLRGASIPPDTSPITAMRFPTFLFKH